MDQRIKIGDSLTVLKEFEPESIQTCVTSPPYWGIRSYLDAEDNAKASEIGMDAKPEEYIDRLVDVFREVRRTLKKDGTLWVNIGDTYASPPPGNKTPRHERSSGSLHSAPRSVGRTMSTVVGDLKEKDLVGIPWMLAFALRKDGWYLRADIIWNKLQSLPESVQDRPSKASEYIFLLSKSSKYHYDKASNEECQRSVWDIATKFEASTHTAVYPIELARRCIQLSTKPQDLVLDPFAGSGTTLAAAVEMDRRAIGIELNSKCLPEIQVNLDNADNYAWQASVSRSMLEF